MPIKSSPPVSLATLRSNIANLTEQLNNANARADADRDAAAKSKLEAKRARKTYKEARKIAKGSRKEAKALRQEVKKITAMVNAADGASKRAASTKKAKPPSIKTLGPRASAPASPVDTSSAA